MTSPAAHPSPYDPQDAGRPARHTPAYPGGAPLWQAIKPCCRICGGMPAAVVSVSAHQGLLLAMRFHKVPGPFCRSCGIAIVRDLSTKTMWQGWWSPFSLIFSLITLLTNFRTGRKLAALAPPGPTAPGYARLPEGAPIHRRPLAYVATVPFVWAIWFIVGVITHL
ncbi:hypothetical protein ADL29_29065 [Streptomyces chattanoogensis]|uniref:Uncharacterized protein n=2 Tax=Streptomyces chattanoogensis TaxID=66876 RepID=A0A0N0GWX0_9ACTN|nr:hypothetical protein ADL29_29065 [Streptomyces chattanoogensis]